jgi:hypothetical protein
LPAIFRFSERSSCLSSSQLSYRTSINNPPVMYYFCPLNPLKTTLIHSSSLSANILRPGLSAHTRLACSTLFFTNSLSAFGHAVLAVGPRIIIRHYILQIRPAIYLCQEDHIASQSFRRRFKYLTKQPVIIILAHETGSVLGCFAISSFKLRRASRMTASGQDG